MKNKFLISVLMMFLVVIGCQEPVKENKKITDNKTANKEVSHEPVFLNLSPRLDYSDFQKKLKENPEIENGKFSIFLYNQIRKFDVIRESSERIVLTHETTISRPKIIQNACEVIQEDFMDLFNSKYKQAKLNLPFETDSKGVYKNHYFYNRADKSLNDYNFKQNHYLLFEDNSKYIFIGFSCENPEGSTIETIRQNYASNEIENPEINFLDGFDTNIKNNKGLASKNKKDESNTNSENINFFEGMDNFSEVFRPAGEFKDFGQDINNDDYLPDDFLYSGALDPDEYRAYNQPWYQSNTKSTKANKNRTNKNKSNVRFEINYFYKEDFKEIWNKMNEDIAKHDRDLKKSQNQLRKEKNKARNNNTKI